MSQPSMMQRAARMGARAELVGLRVVKLRADPGTAIGESAGELVPEIKIGPSFRTEGSLVFYKFDFGLKVKNGRRLVMSASIHYEIAYEVKSSDDDWSDEDLIAFGNVSAIRAVYPYLREQIHRLTLDLGAPPLVIDLFKVAVADPSEL